MRFDCRRMKSPLASSSICSRSICGLNFQSKVSNVLGSSNRASRIRYSTDRSRRAAACWPNSRSRNMRWDRVSLSARSSMVSRSFGAMGIRMIVKWVHQGSRTDQLIKEGSGLRAEFFESLAKEFLFAAQIRARPMFIVGTALARHRSRQAFMVGNLADVGVVNDEFIFRDAHR